ncbi:hypothetical protein ACS127_06095 [Amphibacillus sp. Q70]|uniref:hypothetical protein n=1 Tax=Amphibacillus sp. Q70 TaxID=3453416 RepID=UPI003F871DD4
MKQLSEANQLFNCFTGSLRYNFHICPKSGWSNDPNGLIFFKGYYHIFFQCNPFKTDNSTIYWAHLRSKDLISWEWLPFALAPDKTYDLDVSSPKSCVITYSYLCSYLRGG